MYTYVFSKRRHVDSHLLLLADFWARIGSDRLILSEPIRAGENEETIRENRPLSGGHERALPIARWPTDTTAGSRTRNGSQVLPGFLPLLSSPARFKTRSCMDDFLKRRMHGRRRERCEDRGP